LPHWWTFTLKNRKFDVNSVWIDVNRLWIEDHSKLNVNFMAGAGYSGTPLLKKLGIEPGMKILLIHPPENYFELVEMNISKQLVAGNETPDLIHLFAANNAVFIKR
jgi:hypothetical protein